MRLVTVSVLGTALVVAGMLAPAPGEATGHGDVVVEPGVARPGEQVRVSMPGCRGRARVTSEVLDGRPAGGTATVKADAAPSTYSVVARCGARKATGEVRVAGRLAWPDILPTDHHAR